MKRKAITTPDDAPKGVRVRRVHNGASPQKLQVYNDASGRWLWFLAGTQVDYTDPKDAKPV